MSLRSRKEGEERADIKRKRETNVEVLCILEDRASFGIV